MDINEANLQTLSEYLRQTLNPDPNVRRPGIRYLIKIFLNIFIFNAYLYNSS